MATLTPYLFFDGECRDAVQFYRSCLGGEVEVTTYGQMQGEGCPLAMKDKVMHASLKSEQVVLMASDRPDARPTRGDNVALSLRCDTLAEIETTFAALAEQGTVTYPLHDAPWGDRFGTLLDRYGVLWMLTGPRS